MGFGGEAVRAVAVAGGCWPGAVWAAGGSRASHLLRGSPVCLVKGPLGWESGAGDRS